MVTKEFHSKQIHPAKELRTISQSKLLEMLKKEQKLAFNFNNVTKAMMLDIETYNELIDRLEELEEKVESYELEKRYGERQEPAQKEKWISKPEGMSMAEWYSLYQEQSK